MARRRAVEGTRDARARKRAGAGTRGAKARAGGSAGGRAPGAPASRSRRAQAPAAKAGPAAERARLELGPEALRWGCDAGRFAFETTAELPEFEGIIGQDRAMQAIRLGLRMRSKGYNIYVAGPPGTGKMTTIKHLLKTADAGRRPPQDAVYVNNFIDPDRPRALLLPAGTGARLRGDMKALVVNMQRNIAQIYESDIYKERMKALVEEYKEREKKILRGFEERVRRENFALIQVQLGPFSKPEVAPIIAGEPVQMERLEALTLQKKFAAEDFERLKGKYEELTSEMERVFKEARDLKRELREAMGGLQKEFGSPAVTDYIQDLRAEYDPPGVKAYLDEVQEEILNNMERFTDGEEGAEQDKEKRTAAERESRFREFMVNVLVDNAKTDAPPVIIETSPNYRNLFGTIERVIDRSGHWVSDFTKIKAGSLLQANGGTLVINLIDAIIEPGVWVALKRTLKHQTIDIQTFDPFYLYSISAIKPEPIPLDIKVIVVGDRRAYHILYNLDDDFRKIFKVKAEFDSEMPCCEENVGKYVHFARKITGEEKLRPLTRCGVGALVEFGVRLAGRRNRLSTEFHTIADLIREADLQAAEAGAPAIDAALVRRALAGREARLNLTEEKLRALIEERTILIDTTGEAIGQVNGLSVLDAGDYAFGNPARITAKVALGREGIVNIEREVELSGKTHDKGVLILEGFVRGLFAKTVPLAIHATICFEQSYGGVDGDSASSTEVYALLSALGEFPLRQDIAVTGSVNQHGVIQPIGGVNEKIEG
ncbi:MAG: AAA family ATPase, partial [Candidatus Eisenbacteria bacterium]|nr:AAA family ATPase [Candidatus Eisenbacteria bacterium]